MSRPFENGFLPDTPVGDTVLRRFVFNQGDCSVEMAEAFGGRAWVSDQISLADTGGPISYLNQAILRRPLTGPADTLVDEVEGFFERAIAEGRAHTLLSAWPTPDLTERGWTLVGYPAFVVRGPFLPAASQLGPGVSVEAATTPEDLLAAEQVVVEGFPLDEARGLPPGSVFPPALLKTGFHVRVGRLNGEPVAAGARYLRHGIANLCMAATLPAARRRGVWEALVWARVGDAPGEPAVAYTSDFSRPGFERMGFVPTLRFTLWHRV